MKVGTKYERVAEHTFTLTTAELTEAIQNYLRSKPSWMQPSMTARRETSIDYGDSHDEAVTLTCRYIYDESASLVSQGQEP